MLSPSFVIQLARQYAYGQIHAFRVGHELIGKHYLTMDDDELAGRLTSCIASLSCAHQEGELLVKSLRARALRPFVQGSPLFWWTVGPAIVMCAVLLAYR